jgi:hypothetical protein
VVVALERAPEQVQERERAQERALLWAMLRATRQAS